MVAPGRKQIGHAGVLVVAVQFVVVQVLDGAKLLEDQEGPSPGSRVVLSTFQDFADGAGV